MSELIQSVKEGAIQQSKKAETEKNSNNELGKDAFLQLLVTQMKYQDPMNPNTDTQYIAQLATFSQLEQMQNLNTVSTNSQAFGLVGKDVIVKTENTTGNTVYISGRVDFVNMSGGKAQMSINGSLYPVDQLDSVIDDNYILEKGRPSVEKTDLTYDAANAKDITFAVKLGEGETVADKVAVMIGDNLLDNSLVSIKDSKVTIKKDAFTQLTNGSYPIKLVFNDSLYTTVTDKVKLTVKNAADAPVNNSTTPTTTENKTTEGGAV
jgi:flagellar basal-body rod modification protein FlgD